MKPDLALGLEVLAGRSRESHVSRKEIELEKAAQIAAIKAEDEQITSVARNVLREKLLTTIPTHCARADASKPSKSSPGGVNSIQRRITLLLKMASWLSSAMSKLRKCCASSKRILAPCRLGNWHYQTHRSLSLRVPHSVLSKSATNSKRS